MFEVNGKEFETFEEAQLEVTRMQEEDNNKPNAAFFGLSPRRMMQLLTHPFEEGGLLFIQDPIEDAVLNRMFFLTTAESLLQMLMDKGSIKLTDNGELPDTVAKKLYPTGAFVDFKIGKKLVAGKACFVEVVKDVCRLAGLTKKIKGEYSLTKNGEKALKGNDRLDILLPILGAYMNKFDWTSNDDLQKNCTQFISPFAIYMLTKIYNSGDEITIEEMADKLLHAFPEINTQNREELMLTFAKRFVYAFLYYFGFIAYSEDGTDMSEKAFILNDGFEKTFIVEF